MSFQGLETQRARLEGARAALKARFSKQGFEHDPVDLLRRLGALAERCQELQSQIQEVQRARGELKEELLEFSEFSLNQSERIGNVKEEVGTKLDAKISIDKATEFKETSVRDGDENDSNEKNVSVENTEKSRNYKFEIDEIAFYALPESIRGRARLDEAQRTLSVVVASTVALGNRRNMNGKTTISIKELDAKGAKVVGHTGACVLQCLRSLGLIEVSRTGIKLSS